MRKLMLAAVAAMVLAVAATPAQAGIDEGEWEVALSGEYFLSEAHDNLGFQITIGYFVTAEIEIGGWFAYHRQELDFDLTDGGGDFEIEKTWWDVAVFISWNFNTDGDWTPYIGVFIGSESAELDLDGDDVDRGGFMWGGFVGVRFWIHDNCAIFFEYRLLIRSEDEWDIDDSSSDVDDDGVAHRFAVGFSLLFGGA